MKKNTMKKLLAASLSLSLALSLAACSGGSSSSAQDPAGSGEAAPADGGYKIAVVRQLDHASMNEIRDAIFAELDAKAAELSLTISYEDFNGNNDTSTLSQIGAQILADQYDAIIPIGTLAAQQMVSVAEESQTPVIYGTVSYPEVANLTGIDYVTGTSDALNVELLLDMMLAADPDIQTVGLLYSTSEVNSAPAIEEAKAYLDEKGVSYLENPPLRRGRLLRAQRRFRHLRRELHQPGHPDRRFGPGGPPDRGVPRVCHRVRRHYHCKHRHRLHAGPGLLPVPGHGFPGGGGPDHPGLIGILKKPFLPLAGRRGVAACFD